MAAGQLHPSTIGAASTEEADGSKSLNVHVTSTSASAGDATAGNQTTEIAKLTSIDGKLPALIGGRVPVDASVTLDPVGLALDATVAALEVTQGSTTSGQKGVLSQGAVTTNQPSYTNAQTSPLSLTPKGRLRVDAATINVAATSGAISVTTSASQAQVGGSPLANRKILVITPTNGTIYYGASNAVTTVNGTPIFANQSITFEFTDNVPIWLISGGTVDVRIVEAS